MISDLYSSKGDTFLTTKNKLLYMWTHYKRNIILLIIFLIILFAFLSRSRLIQPINANSEQLAAWRAQQEVFLIFFPYSMIFDSNVSKIYRINEDIFINNDIYKIQLSQKTFDGDTVVEYTIGVHTDNIVYLLPRDHSFMVLKDRMSIGFPYLALLLSEIYANFTSDISRTKAIYKDLNYRIVLQNSSDIPQNEEYPIPAQLEEIISEPDAKLTNGGSKYKLQFYTWESSGGKVHEWDMTVFFDGRVFATKSVIANAGICSEC